MATDALAREISACSARSRLSAFQLETGSPRTLA